MKIKIEYFDRVALLAIARYLNNTELGNLRICSRRMDHILSAELYDRIRKHLKIADFRLFFGQAASTEICTADGLRWHQKQPQELRHNSFYICSGRPYQSDEDLGIQRDMDVSLDDCSVFLTPKNQTALKTLSVHKLYTRQDVGITTLNTALLVTCTDGTIWGLESFNQLSLQGNLRYVRPKIGLSSNLPTLTQIPFLCLAVKAISMRKDRSFILTTDGRLFACGDNSSGQIGISGLKKVDVFTEIKLHRLGSIYDFETLIARRKPKEFVKQCHEFILYNRSYTGIIDKKFEELIKICTQIKKDIDCTAMIIEAIISYIENSKFNRALTDKVISTFEFDVLFPKVSSGFFSSLFKDLKYDLALARAYCAVALDINFQTRVNYICNEYMRLSKETLQAYQVICEMPTSTLITAKIKERANAILSLIHDKKSRIVNGL